MRYESLDNVELMGKSRIAKKITAMKKKFKTDKKFRKKVVGTAIASALTGGAAGRIARRIAMAKALKKNKKMRKIAAGGALFPLTALVPGSKTVLAAIAAKKLIDKKRKATIKKQIVNAPVVNPELTPAVEQSTGFAPSPEASQDTGNFLPENQVQEPQDEDQQEEQSEEQTIEPEKKKFNPLMLAALAVPFFLG